MPISARWRKISTLPEPRGRDAMPGVYELADIEKKVIYIGQSLTDVPNRIRQHLQGHACILLRVAYWRYAYSRVPQAQEAQLLAAYLTKHGAAPPCNKALPRPRDAQRRYRERSRG
jgi:excinuclease UvrABC nuclease subunit